MFSEKIVIGHGPCRSPSCSPLLIWSPLLRYSLVGPDTREVFKQGFHSANFSSEPPVLGSSSSLILPSSSSSSSHISKGTPSATLWTWTTPTNLRQSCGYIERPPNISETTLSRSIFWATSRKTCSSPTSSTPSCYSVKSGRRHILPN